MHEVNIHSNSKNDNEMVIGERRRDEHMTIVECCLSYTALAGRLG